MFNPLSSNINRHVLLTTLHIFLMPLIRDVFIFSDYYPYFHDLYVILIEIRSCL